MAKKIQIQVDLRTKRKVIEYYQRKDIQEEIFRFSKDREIGLMYWDGHFGSRPKILVYPSDVGEYAKDGVVSFHCSVERWIDPLALDKGEKLDELRKGWDLVLDIDCKYLRYSKIAADIIIDFLKSYGIKHFWVKFSGGSGFHIILPFEIFPKKYGNKDIVSAYTIAGRDVIEFIKIKIKDRLRDCLLKAESYDIETIAKNAQVPEEVLGELKQEFDPFKVVKIDAMTVSPRHLIRMPYSINEKKILVSVPIENNNVRKFEVDQARIENVTIVENFFRIEEIKTREALLLFEDTYNFVKKAPTQFVTQIAKEIREFVKTKKIEKVSPEDFPPCIKRILEGLEDGRKRALFVLVSFLMQLGYPFPEIEKIVWDWNQRNKPPLRESYVKSQLKWFAKLKEPYMPPNCENQTYIQEIGICNPDEICKKYNVKNPLVYVYRKIWSKRCQKK